jgi:hypothetical protein
MSVSLQMEIGPSFATVWQTQEATRGQNVQGSTPSKIHVDVV